jgi:hypothetical protein
MVHHETIGSKDSKASIDAIKQMALRLSNLKNIQFTLAKIHKLRRSSLLSDENFYKLIDK